MRYLWPRIVVLMLALAAGTAADVHGPAGDGRRIDALIHRLGAEDYALRQQAREELKQIGYAAFDRLLEAQYDRNSEVSLTARQLISQFTIRWVQPQDPDIVGHVLRGYQDLSSDERTQRGEWLAELEDGLGTSALSRIIRYEPAEVVAKTTALTFIERFDANDPLQREALGHALERVLQGSNRSPARWLRAFHTDLVEPQNADSLAQWKLFYEQELQLGEGPRSDRAITARLVERYATRAVQQGKLPALREALPLLVELRKDSPYGLVRTAHWLLDLDPGAEFTAFTALVAPEDQAHPGVAYCLAEYQRKQGNAEMAEKTAQEAFRSTAVPGRLGDPVTNTNERFRWAVTLEQRGLIEWSLREYQRIIDEEAAHWFIAERRQQSFKLMAELLHDTERHQEAADVLAKLLEEAGGGPFRNDELGEETAGIVSRMHFFRAEHYRKLGDRQKQIEMLRKAVEADRTDADVLIAMYRLPRADEAWQQETRRYIRDAVRTFEENIQRLKSGGVLANREEISTLLNQVAWLVGNTEGDFRKAVQQSRRSLELKPQYAGSLDTLGRTYFAVGDLPNALKYQRRAVKLLPHSRQIQRQLDEFERAAHEQKDAP